MTRVAMVGLVAVLAAATPYAAPQNTDANVQTWTGWFSDKQCARAPAAGESVRPNETECVKKCLSEGSASVFLSEQANAIYNVQNHTSVKDDVGYRVELTGVVDEKAKTISVQSVKRLSAVTSMCLVPKKTQKK